MSSPFIYPRHFHPYARIQPFQYRDAQTLIKTMEELRQYIVEYFTPQVQGKFEEYHDAINNLIDVLNAAIREVQENVDKTANVVERGEKTLEAVNRAIVKLEALRDSSEQILAEVGSAVDSANTAAQLAANSVEEARQAALDVLKTYRTDWSQITNIPTTFKPEPHNHAAKDITSGVLDSARIPLASTSKTGAVKFAVSKDINSNEFLSVSPQIAREIAANATAFHSSNANYNYQPEEYSRRIHNGKQQIFLLGEWRDYPCVYGVNYTGGVKTLTAGWNSFMPANEPHNRSGEWLTTNNDPNGFQPAIDGYYDITAVLPHRYGESSITTQLGLINDSVTTNLAKYNYLATSTNVGSDSVTLSATGVKMNVGDKWRFFYYISRATQNSPSDGRVLTIKLNV